MIVARVLDTGMDCLAQYHGAQLAYITKAQIWTYICPTQACKHDASIFTFTFADETVYDDEESWNLQ